MIEIRGLRLQNVNFLLNRFRLIRKLIKERMKFSFQSHLSTVEIEILFSVPMRFEV